MKQVISIMLSLLLLLSSTGLTYAQHFCGDFEMMAKITIGQAQLTCGMTEVHDACDDETKEDHNCCDNEYSQIEIDDNFASIDYTFQAAPIFVAAFINVFVHKTEILLHKEHSFFAQYHPPPLIKDIPVLYETYLI